MSSTLQRDRASALAKSDPKQALAIARSISDPWFRAQALSWVARFTDGDPLPIAKQAAKAASECDDDYKRSSVRAWEIAALAERNLKSEAKKTLNDAVRLARGVHPFPSRSEALFLLLQSAFTISSTEANFVREILIQSCPVEEHWRCSRAVRDTARIQNGELAPRPFFW